MKLSKLLVIVGLVFGCKAVNTSDLQEALIQSNGEFYLLWTIGNEDSPKEVVCRARCSGVYVTSDINTLRSDCRHDIASRPAANFKENEFFMSILGAARKKGSRQYTESPQVLQAINAIYSRPEATEMPHFEDIESSDSNSSCTDIPDEQYIVGADSGRLRNSLTEMERMEVSRRKGNYRKHDLVKKRALK